jgi:hypothetical protein
LPPGVPPMKLFLVSGSAFGSVESAGSSSISEGAIAAVAQQTPGLSCAAQDYPIEQSHQNSNYQIFRHVLIANFPAGPTDASAGSRGCGAANSVDWDCGIGSQCSNGRLSPPASTRRRHGNHGRHHFLK